MGLLTPFTSAEEGTLGQLFEVLGFLYILISLVAAPIMWCALDGMQDPNRLRRYLRLLSIPFVWPIMVAVWGARRLAAYVDRDFRREWRELWPKRKATPVLKSPRELGLWE